MVIVFNDTDDSNDSKMSESVHLNRKTFPELKISKQQSSYDFDLSQKN